MRKKGDIGTHPDDIMEPQTHDMHIQEILIDDDHLEKDLLADELGDDAPLDEEDEFGMDHAMDPYEEYN